MTRDHASVGNPEADRWTRIWDGAGVFALLYFALFAFHDVARANQGLLLMVLIAVLRYPRELWALRGERMLQLALLCGLPRFDGPSLPLSIARCELAADPGVGPYQCELRVRDGSAQHTRCDAVLIAADGRVVVRIEGLQMFALPRAAAAE